MWAWNSATIWICSSRLWVQGGWDALNRRRQHGETPAQHGVLNGFLGLIGLQEHGFAELVLEEILRRRADQTVFQEDITRWHGQDQTIADAVRIQYGGSCKPSNANELFAQPDIDGGLIGGAALKANSFVSLVESARALAK